LGLIVENVTADTEELSDSFEGRVLNPGHAIEAMWFIMDLGERLNRPELIQKATEIALKVSEAFHHVGLLAVEMFQTADDEILVNEVAPRPHNSGHYSIEASYTSQFENHLRAILNLPLGNTDSKVAGIMVNLVGEEGFSGQVVYENIEKIMAIDGVTPHIYGKRETRPFRKMGHVTIVNENMTEARKIAEEVKNSIRVISQ
jgi:5-(carboxyamino)imidazole ribonucleotide synthase